MSGGILSRIVAPERPALPDRALVVVAHPDDETLGCGGLLSRLTRLTIVHVTDGAPRDGADAARHGFGSVAEYAAARRRELEAALAAGGAGHARLESVAIPDQGAAFAIAAVARRLVPLMADADLVLTHAVEGGHPDHDATAVAVHAAAAIRSAKSRAPTILEMPLYRAGAGDAWARQSFPDPGGVAILRLAADERARKSAMIAAHRSQAATLASFGAADEPYRIAELPDLAEAPNGGAVLYERYGWGVSSATFLELARAALAELGLEPRHP